VTFPGGTRITDKRSNGAGGDITYDFLGATAEPRNPGELTLVLTVRGTGTGPVDANFSVNTFRLRVGDTTRAPVNFFSDVVEVDTSMEQVLEFAVPDAPGTHTLRTETAKGKVELPVEVQPR
jgi:hypothetical protein